MPPDTGVTAQRDAARGPAGTSSDGEERDEGEGVRPTIRTPFRACQRFNDTASPQDQEAESRKQKAEGSPAGLGDVRLPSNVCGPEDGGGRSRMLLLLAIDRRSRAFLHWPQYKG